MSDSAARANVEGLPKQFVSSLKVLFDILDEERSGYVRLVDIEIRWHGEGVRGLPVGVIQALRKVTPASGCLSFERFVMGLKLAMLKNKHNFAESNENNRRTPTNEMSNYQSGSSLGEHLGLGPAEVRNNVDLQTEKGVVVKNRVIPLHHIGHSDQHTPNLQSQITGHRTYGTAITATVRPNNAINTIAPALLLEGNDRLPQGQAYSNHNANANMYSSSGTSNAAGVDRERYTHNSASPPPRPVRSLYNNNPPVQLPQRASRLPFEVSSKVPPQVPPRDYRKSAKSVIIHELKQWQKERQRSQYVPPKPPRINSASSDSRLLEKKSNPNHDIYVNLEDLPTSKSEEYLKELRPTSKVEARRRDSRRHTLSNGVDYNMVKRSKQLEEEKSILRKGLDMSDKVRDWYLKQITCLDAKQRNFSNPSVNDFSAEESQRKLNHLRLRINEFIHHSHLLSDTSDKAQALVGQMNLAVKSVPVYDETITINMLKEQNRQLTKEVGEKGEKITKLEQEKASLIREMFEGRALAKNKVNYDDTTFM